MDYQKKEEGVFLKKIILVFTLFLTLVACSKPTPGLEEVTKVPKDIQEQVNPEYRLQSIWSEDGGSYIIFQSTGDVEADIQIDGKSVRIQFEETNTKDASFGIQQYTYYLYLEGEDNFLEVYVNDESMPFNTIVL